VSSAASETAAAVLTASVRLRDQGRTDKQRGPIESSFHVLVFLSLNSFCVVNFWVIRIVEFNEHRHLCSSLRQKASIHHQ
jgi:hypothetical protein